MNKKHSSEISYHRFIFLNKLISFSFSTLILILYFSFILIIGFAPDLFGVFLFDSYLTLGIVAGLSIILFSILITFVYTIIANKYLDKLRGKIK